MPVKNCKIGKGSKIWHPDLVNLYGCEIGENCNVGAFVEIGPGVFIGDDVRIAAHCFIPEGVKIESGCFIGPRVTFTNDPYPPSNRESWKSTVVCKGASIGAGAIILPGVTIGEGALIGAGSIISRNVLPGAKVYGEAARQKGDTNCENRGRSQASGLKTGSDPLSLEAKPQREGK
jgi:UDP-2-acetamido-3-amino-2,3-dideoxy-glucuronate N-acetyltransferase